ESGGLDASAIGGEEGIQFAGHGCVFVSTPTSNSWETMSAEKTTQTLQYESWLKGVVEIKKKDFPATYLFKTARGECGILQILGFTEEKPNPGGVKIRYKLVETRDRGFVVPFLSAEERIAVITEAHKAFTDFMHSDRNEQDGEN